MINSSDIDSVIENYINGNRKDSIKLLMKGRKGKPLALMASTALVLQELQKHYKEEHFNGFIQSLKFYSELDKSNNFKSFK
jgi:hypothetical protein